MAATPGLATRLLEEGVFSQVFVPPAPGSDGAALGAALAVGCARGQARPEPLQDPFLGPAWPAAHVRRVLINAELAVSQVEAAPGGLAGLLAEHGALAWFQGRLEFASRTLGSRAVLCDPARADVVAALRGRLGGGPLGLAVPEERCAEWFLLDGSSPFGHLVPACRDRTREACSGALAACSGALADQERLPVQTVARAVQPRLWDLLEQREAQVGCPVLAVLPLALPNEPLACRPEEALDVCRTAGLTCLVAEDFTVALSGPTPAKGP